MTMRWIRVVMVAAVILTANLSAICQENQEKKAEPVTQQKPEQKTAALFLALPEFQAGQVASLQSQAQAVNAEAEKAVNAEIDKLPVAQRKAARDLLTRISNINRAAQQKLQGLETLTPTIFYQAKEALVKAGKIPPGEIDQWVPIRNEQGVWGFTRQAGTQTAAK